MFLQRNGTAPAKSSEDKAAAAKPALTVTVTQPKQMEWPRSLAANGNITAWQEVLSLLVIPAVFTYVDDVIEFVRRQLRRPAQESTAEGGL